MSHEDKYSETRKRVKNILSSEAECARPNLRILKKTPQYEISQNSLL